MELFQGASAETQPRSFELMEATIPQLQAALAAGIVTSRDLVAMYLARIEAYDKHGPALNAISVNNASALAEAAALDAERRTGATRGPLHGIPMIVKDNYETIGMQTADGSLALAGWIPSDDAYLAKKLRTAGAIIIAKSNMHEFAYGIITVGSHSAQPATRTRWTATQVAQAAALALLSPPTSRQSVWAATLAARFAFLRPITVSSASGGPRVLPVAAASSRSLAPRTLADRSAEPSRMSLSCWTRSSATTLPTRRPLRALGIFRRVTLISCNSPDYAALASDW